MMGFKMASQPIAATSNVTAITGRAGRRIVTISRIAMIEFRGKSILAKVHNISDGGVEISLATALPERSRVRLHLSTLLSLDAVVVWQKGRSHGLEFSSQIDCATVLRQLVQDTRSGRTRPFRVSVRTQVAISSGMGVTLGMVENISQRGVLILHSAHFEPGIPIKIALPGCAERRGTVRWSRDGRAGISLADPFTLDEIAMQLGFDPDSTTGGQ